VSGTSGTVETDNTLLTQFEDGQAAGSITPQDVRNIIVSETSHITAAINAALPSATAAQLYGGTAAAGAAAAVTVGTGLAVTSGTLATVPTPETALTFAATMTWNVTTNPICYVILTANTTITVSGGVAGQNYRLGLIQNATGGYTVTLAGCTILGSPLWATAANGVNIVTIDRMNGVSYAAVA
jgi:hypothetical protein